MYKLLTFEKRAEEYIVKNIDNEKYRIMFYVANYSIDNHIQDTPYKGLIVSYIHAKIKDIPERLKIPLAIKLLAGDIK